MLRKTGWAVGLLLLLSQYALGQAPEEGEKIPLPIQPGVKMDGASPLGPLLTQPTAARAAPLFYVDADFLYWWVNHGPAPALLTTAPNNGLNPKGLTGGIIGQPGTQVLFDGHNLDYGGFSAVRAKAGVNLGPDGFWSLEFGGFLLPTRSINTTFSGSASGAPLLTVPFLDAATGQQSALDINSQNSLGQPYLTGNMTIHSDIQVWGYEADIIAHSIRAADRSVDLLFGFRSLTLNENLNINQTISGAQDGTLTLQSPIVGQGAANYLNVLANSPVFVTDQFSTRNEFYGAQVGARFRWDSGPWSADLNAKVAVGVTHEQATINGSTTATAVSNPNTGVVSANLTTPGGFFALQNNIGAFSQNQFSVVPEIGFNLRYEVTSWMHLKVGYSAMYWSNVARPGAQIDSTLNSKLIPSGPLLPTTTLPVGAFIPGAEQGRPYFVFRDTAFWAQGINIGVEFRF